VKCCVLSCSLHGTTAVSPQKFKRCLKTHLHTAPASAAPIMSRRRQSSGKSREQLSLRTSPRTGLRTSLRTSLPTGMPTGPRTGLRRSPRTRVSPSPSPSPSESIQRHAKAGLSRKPVRGGKQSPSRKRKPSAGIGPRWADPEQMRKRSATTRRAQLGPQDYARQPNRRSPSARERENGEGLGGSNLYGGAPALARSTRQRRNRLLHVPSELLVEIVSMLPLKSMSSTLEFLHVQAPLQYATIVKHPQMTDAFARLTVAWWRKLADSPKDDDAPVKPRLVKRTKVWCRLRISRSTDTTARFVFVPATVADDWFPPQFVESAYSRKRSSVGTAAVRVHVPSSVVLDSDSDSGSDSDDDDEPRTAEVLPHRLLPFGFAGSPEEAERLFVLASKKKRASDA